MEGGGGIRAEKEQTMLPAAGLTFGDLLLVSGCLHVRSKYASHLITWTFKVYNFTHISGSNKSDKNAFGTSILTDHSGTGTVS